MTFPVLACGAAVLPSPWNDTCQAPPGQVTRWRTGVPESMPRVPGCHGARMVAVQPAAPHAVPAGGTSCGPDGAGPAAAYSSVAGGGTPAKPGTSRPCPAVPGAVTSAASSTGTPGWSAGTVTLVV